jgi:DinB superfamily
MGPHVWQAADGRWVADWPEDEAYALGPPSIAWLTWHVGFWWSTVLDHSFGEGRLHREEISWPGGADAAIRWIHDLQSRWKNALDPLDETDFASPALSRWPFSDRSFAEVAAWVNLELTKNAAEIGYARFLYASRQ